MKKCSECGFQNGDRETACGNCGAQLPVSPPAEEMQFCPSCGKQLKMGLKFCTGCGCKLSAEQTTAPAAPSAKQSAPSATSVATAAASGKKFGKPMLFAILSGALSFLTVLFALVFLFTPFLKVSVSMFGLSDAKSVSGISVFASLLSGNATLTELGVSTVLGYIASAVYWIFAFVFAGYIVYAVSSIGSANRGRFRTGIKLLAALTVLALVIMILGNVAAGQATKDAKDYVQLGAEISQYVSGTGLFITMLLMLGGYITLYVLYKGGKDRHPFAASSKACKPVKVVLYLALSVLLAVSIIVGIVNLVGTSSKSLVKKYIDALNNRDVVTVAECLYPKGSTEYNAMIAMGASALPSYAGRIGDWNYQKIESNDYVERGRLRITVASNPSSESVFYMQKSSQDNKWHITDDYTPAYYDGNVGTSYANAKFITAASAGDARYLLYECEKSDRYLITAETAFAVTSFATSNITNGSATAGTPYTAVCNFTAGRAYYIVLDSACACSIARDASVGADNVIGSLRSEITNLTTEEKVYGAQLAKNTLLTATGQMQGGGITESGVLFTLYDAKFVAIEGMINKPAVFYDAEQPCAYVGIKAANEQLERVKIGRHELSAADGIDEREVVSFSKNSNLEGRMYTFIPPKDSTYSVTVATVKYSSSSSSDVATVVLFDGNMAYVASTKKSQNSADALTYTYSLQAGTKYSIAVLYPSSSFNYGYLTVQDSTSGTTCDTARTITPGTAQTDSISAVGDTRWYKFTATRSYNCTVYTTGDKDTYGVLYRNGSYYKIGSDDDGGTDSNFMITYKVSAGETYYIAVRLNGEETGAFALEVSRYEDGANYETAYTVRTGSSNGATVTNNSGNETYYRFVAGETRSYRVYTTGSATVQVTVQDAEGNTVVSKTSVSPANADLEFDAEKGAEYFVIVRIVNGSSSSSSKLIVANN